MKKFIVLLAGVLLFNITFGKIWRVNNIPDVMADFTTVQAAHDHASVMIGDTLHIEPSLVNYGNLTMTKRLTIISIGNFLTANPGLQYSAITGIFNGLTITNVSASGSVFHCNFISASISAANNLRFERCVVTDFLNFAGSNSNIIMNCYLSTSTFSNSNGNVIANNIYNSTFNVTSSAAAVITNNVFSATTGNTSSVNNSFFQNNIINKASSYSFVNSTVTNNLCSNTTLPAGNGNQLNVDMVSVFVNPNGANDTSFVLQTATANPAVGAGTGGINAGAYGGSDPFKPGVQAAIPAIYKIVAPVSPSGSTMNVVFSTRSNN